MANKLHKSKIGQEVENRVDTPVNPTDDSKEIVNVEYFKSNKAWDVVGRSADNYTLTLQDKTKIVVPTSSTKNVIIPSGVFAGTDTLIIQNPWTASELEIDISALTNAHWVEGRLSKIKASGRVTVFFNTDSNVFIYGDLVENLSAGVPKEEAIIGTALYNGAATGTVDLDLATFVDAYLILTGNTILTVSNTPAEGESFVRTLTVKSTATESLELPIDWTLFGEFAADGSENHLSIKFTNYPTIGLKVVCNFL